MRWRAVSGQAAQAELVAFEAIDEYDKLTTMEQAAASGELDRLLLKHPDVAYLLFAEDRQHPIRMRDHLPQRWVDVEQQDECLQGSACRGEFYAFQIGVFAAGQEAIEDLAIVVEDLRPLSAMGRPIPASAVRCFNTSGIDCCGGPFEKTVSVQQGTVGALWFGVQIPADAEPGAYRGRDEMHPAGEPGKRVVLRLEVGDESLEDAGDSEPWRHSRLRWLDSTIAQDDELTSPFTPLVVNDNTIACLGRSVTLAATGLPESIRSFFTPEMTHLTSEDRQILAKPIRFMAELPKVGTTAFEGGELEMVKQSAGEVAWRSTSSADSLQLCCAGSMEFDGHITFHMQLRADRATQVDDLILEIPLCCDVASYMMGMGRPGGVRPAEYDWRWDRRNNQDSVWLGDVNAGLRCRLFGENYRRPVINIHYHHLPLNLPPAWHNDGLGSCSVREQGDDSVVLRAATGPRTVSPGEVLHFNFTLLITPLKPLNTDGHWARRYYHAYHPPDR